MVLFLFSTCRPVNKSAAQKNNGKKIVLIAGAKSHGPGDHEYIKSVRLIKTMLDNSNVENIQTEIHYNGWPEPPSTLETADLVLFISDGRDGHLFSDVPFMTSERMNVMDKLMKKGCGFSVIHFSTFASDTIGRSVLQWGGGYFDWQDDEGKRNWYSSILHLDARVELNKQSPVTKGVNPFRVMEEFYYNIRFNNNPNVQPVVEVPALSSNKPMGNCVAWTIERPDGGRGFSTTMGHFYSNWKNPDFRKLLLNGIVWASGAAVPENGVEARYYSNKEIIQHLYGRDNSALILTGHHHPGHDWKGTTPLIKSAIESQQQIHADISTNINDLVQYDLEDYNFLVLNYCNWNDPKGLSKEAKEKFVQYLKNGGGLMIVHFANGAFHYSLPGAGASDWPEFRNICYRVWDHASNSSHDDYGDFEVNIADKSHPVTKGMNDFTTTDELYFNQKGIADNLQPLITAKSMVTGKDEPLAWVYNYGRGKIFQTVLGHAPESFKSTGVQQLLSNAATWLAKEESTAYEASENWSFTGGSAGAAKYSSLDQINRNNVSKLKVAWVYHSGNKEGNVQLNPLAINGIVYITTPASELIALNGADGKEMWKFNPSRAGEVNGGVNRGIAYWKDGTDERIIYTSGSYLNSINAKTGKPIVNFGDDGRIDISEGLIKPAGEMKVISPANPVIYKDVIVIGGTSWSAPANVSGFDAHTGKRKWVFNLVPHPGEESYNTWGDTSFYRTGAGVNVWGGMSLDQQNGIVYVATGQPKDDFFRPANKGAQLYGNSVVAIDAATGKKKWHYQTIHHDLWDLDLPCAPILTDLYKDGIKVPGLVQLSKTGNVFLFNRITGELLSKVEERPAPKSKLKGEYSYPTQPFVTWPEPFSKQVLTESDLTDIDSASHAAAYVALKNSDTGWFVPPSEKGIIYYGIHGGAEWGGGAYDPKENNIYVNSNELAWNIKMRDINAKTISNEIHSGEKVYLKYGCVSCHGAKREGQGAIPALLKLNNKYSKEKIIDIIRMGKKAMPAFTQIPRDDMEQLAAFLLNMKVDKKEKNSTSPIYRSLGYNKFLDANGYPATKPPWGTLNAINLRTGKIDWKVPLGEYDELTSRGIPVTGTENFGGCIVTNGGFVFIAATRDEKVRAFDKYTGDLLWQDKLPHGGFSTPATYMVNGKQYFVIAATGGGKLGTPTGDTYVAYALP